MAYRSYILLNVVAHPHPEGVYRRLFESASERKPVKYRGDRFARISPIAIDDDGSFRGRLATWLEIDPNSPSVNKSSLEEKSLIDAGISLPDDIGFNSKIFYFAFREEGHALYVELVNDEGRSITPAIARSAFSAILSDAMDGIADDLLVHIASRQDAVEYILSLKTIRKIEIDLHVPNPDDLSDGHQLVLAEIEALKAKRLQTIATKAAGEETLILTDRYKVMAELAADNGEFSAEGTDSDGSKSRRSTKDLPATIEEEINNEDSSYAVIRRIAKEGKGMNLINDDPADEYNVFE